MTTRFITLWREQVTSWRRQCQPWFSLEYLSTLKAIKSNLKLSYDKQNHTLVVISYEINETCRRLVSWILFEMTTSVRCSIYLYRIAIQHCTYPADRQRWNNIAINNKICRVPRKLFEHEAARPSVQISSEGPGKCYCNEITMNDHCSCITNDSNGKLRWKCPKVPYKLFKCDGKSRWGLVQNIVNNDASCAMTLCCHHKLLKCYVQGDNVTSLNVM